MDDSYSPDTHPPVFQQSSHSQSSLAWFVEQPVYLLNLTHLLPSTSTMGVQTSHPPMNVFYKSYEEMQHYCTSSVPSYPAYFLYEGTQSSPSVSMSSTQSQHHLLSTFELQAENRGALIGPQSRSTAALPGNVGAFKLGNSNKPSVKVSKTKACRLMKNSQAARAYRQKKKDYIRSLEDRVVELDNQNRTLVQEIRTLMNT